MCVFILIGGFNCMSTHLDHVMQYNMIHMYFYIHFFLYILKRLKQESYQSEGDQKTKLLFKKIKQSAGITDEDLKKK